MDRGWRTYSIVSFCHLTPDNEDLKVLVYDFLFIPWVKGDFFLEFVSEYTGSFLITSQKPSGVIREISPVDIWRRTTGHSIVQDTQKINVKTCIDTYPNSKKLSLSNDCASHCLYFLNTSYSDPAFTSAEVTEDPWVIMKFDLSNVFVSLAPEWYWMYCWRLWNIGPWFKDILWILQPDTHMWIYLSFLLL